MRASCMGPVVTAGTAELTVCVPGSASAGRGLVVSPPVCRECRARFWPEGEPPATIDLRELCGCGTILETDSVGDAVRFSSFCQGGSSSSSS